jgi:hypothetical protein
MLRMHAFSAASDSLLNLLISKLTSILGGRLLHLQPQCAIRLIFRGLFNDACSTETICRPIVGWFLFIINGGRLSPLGTATTVGVLYQPQMIDDCDCGAIGGMKIGRGNRNTRRIPAPVSLCPSQIPHDLTRARTRAAAGD